VKLHGTVVFLVFAAGGVSAAAQDTLCLSCHAEKGSPFQASVHSAIACAGCHSDIKGFPHPEKVAKVNCASCHSDSASALAASVHANAAAQACAACHGDAHGMIPVKDPKSPVFASNLPRTCGACHGDRQFAQRHGLKEVYSEYMDSIHGFALTQDGLLVSATCSSCHGAHDILRPNDSRSRVNRTNISATCGACHQGIRQQYLSGIHGQMLQAGHSGAPVCTSCHTAHRTANVRDASFQVQTPATCGGCHRQEYGTYRDTFHSQAAALGYTESAHCWDCHGAHDILPRSDPKSTIAPANLVRTCAKCHSGANAGFVSYEPHADRHNGRQYPLLHASSIFMNLLLAGMLGFFALHTALWFIRSKAEKPGREGRKS
jgi:predicted CXXCH cytochrome family protein